MALTLIPASDDILSLSGDIQEEIYVIDANHKIILSNGASAHLVWRTEGFVWFDVSELTETSAASEDDWPTLHTDDEIEWIKVVNLDDETFNIYLSDKAEEKIKALVEGALDLSFEGVDFDDSESIAKPVIAWLLVNGKLNL